MRINTNVSAASAYRNLSMTQSAVNSSMQKLSSGFRINRAADDAAGLGIANRLRATTRSLTQAQRNAEQTNSLLQIAEGGTGTVQKMLERMKELATQAASDTVDADDRAKIQAEFEELQGEITRTVSTTKFGDKALLDGSFGNTVDTNTTNSTALGVNSQNDGADTDDTTADAVIKSVSITGTKTGAYEFDVDTTNNKISLIDKTNNITQTLTVDETTLSAGDTISFSEFGVEITLGDDFGMDAAATNGVTAAGKAADLTALDAKDIDVLEGDAQFMVSSSGDYGGDDAISLANFDLTIGTLGIDTSSLATRTDAETALTAIDSALTHVAETFGQIGAAQNRLEYAMDNVKTSIQNLSAAESVIRDVDMAEEMTKFSKNQILQQAGTAMLAQANQAGQGVLQLLRG